MSIHGPAIDTFIQAHLDHYIAETSELCAHPSVSATSEGTQECAGLVADILQRHGLEVQQYPTPGNPIVVGRAPGQSDRTLLFYNHYDVQPPEPLELWTSPPFEPTVRDGALYARGAKDDKGELIARLAALDAVRAAHGGTLPCGVVFVVEGEEEIGSPHVAQFVQDHAADLRAQGAIWEEGGINPDGQPTSVLGVRGVLVVSLTAQTMSMDAHSGGAHNLPSAAWRLVQALAALKGPDERILIPGFYDDVKPPSDLDKQLLNALPDHEALLRDTFGVKEFIRGRTGRELHHAVFEPTCNIQGITTGYQGEGMKTVIPAQATTKLDFRLVPDQDPEDILAKLRGHLDAKGFADVEVRRLGAMWPAKSAADDPLVKLTTSTGEEVYKTQALITPLAGGSTPIYAFANPLGGIPVVNPGLGYWDNRTHAPDEHIRLQDFVNATRHIARILDGFAQL